jgi:hypothetical protein
MVGSISSITSAASASLIQRPDRDAQRTKVLKAVADKLGMSVDDLRSALDKGASLNQIATTKGVSHEDLISTITSSISGSTAAGAAPLLDDTRLEQLAERIASSTGTEGPKGPHGVKGAHRPPPPPPPVSDADDDDDDSTSTDSALSNVATLLKMKPSELVDALTKGTSLESLAEQQGVSLGQVLGAVSKGMLLNVNA